MWAAKMDSRFRGNDGVPRAIFMAMAAKKPTAVYVSLRRLRKVVVVPVKAAIQTKE